MSWFVDTGSTFVVQLGSGESLRFNRNEWQKFYSSDASETYLVDDEVNGKATKQVVFSKQPIAILKVIERHSVEEPAQWDYCYSLHGIYLTITESIREIQERMLEFDSHWNELLSSSFAKLDKPAYFHYLLKLAIDRLEHLIVNAPTYFLAPEPTTLPTGGLDVKLGEVPESEERRILPDYEINLPVEVIYQQESVRSVINEIVHLAQHFPGEVGKKLLDDLMPLADFLFNRHRPFEVCQVEALKSWLGSRENEFAAQASAQPKLDPQLPPDSASNLDREVFRSVSDALAKAGIPGVVGLLNRVPRCQQVSLEMIRLCQEDPKNYELSAQEWAERYNVRKEMITGNKIQNKRPCEGWQLILNWRALQEENRKKVPKETI